MYYIISSVILFSCMVSVIDFRGEGWIYGSDCGNECGIKSSGTFGFSIDQITALLHLGIH